jgi:hypothetical protein
LDGHADLVFLLFERFWFRPGHALVVENLDSGR